MVSESWRNLRNPLGVESQLPPPSTPGGIGCGTTGEIDPNGLRRTLPLFGTKFTERVWMYAPTDAGRFDFKARINYIYQLPVNIIKLHSVK